MEFHEWYAEHIELEGRWTSPTELLMRKTWNAAIKESAETAENTKSPKFTKSWNEACDEIAKEIRKAK